jgi:hypothetical protein
MPFAVVSNQQTVRMMYAAVCTQISRSGREWLTLALVRSNSKCAVPKSIWDSQNMVGGEYLRSQSLGELL